MFSGHNRKAVVTGLGVLAPNGNTKDSFWSSLLECRSGIGPVTLFNPEGLRSRIAGEVKNFDPYRYIPANLRPEKRMARASQFAVAATSMAIEDARLSLDEIRSFDNLPIFIGVSTSAMDIRERPPKPWSAVAGIPNAVGSAVAFTLGLNAKLVTVSTGCASGIDAIAAGATEIEHGKSDIVIAGASDAAVVRYVFECFTGARKLSQKNDEPENSDRPFDRDRDGGVISEGAGVVILENIEHAKARGANAYCKIAAYGTSADIIGSDEGSGLKKAIQIALDNAPVKPCQVDYINAHAPGDKHMDRYETSIIKNVFGSHAYRVPISSIKGVTGNPMGVGCALQFIASSLAIRSGIVPPTANLENPDPDCDLDYVPLSPRKHDIRIALINTHGFGRGNSALLVERTP